jgi:hypothetical protein
LRIKKKRANLIAYFITRWKNENVREARYAALSFFKTNVKGFGKNHSARTTINHILLDIDIVPNLMYFFEG